mmetsp:Transcript_62239/g.131555  ORF Transcript_62239/g.131555 Transcript_62239/m.131555 type:complete len:407 (-) Transcript_62239:37-1257(-)
MYGLVRGVIARGERTEVAARQLDRQDPTNAGKAQFEAPARFRFVDERSESTSVGRAHSEIPSRLRFAEDGAALGTVGEYIDLSSSSLGPMAKSARRALQHSSSRFDDDSFPNGFDGEKALAARVAMDCCESLARLLNVEDSEVQIFGSMSVPLALETLVRLFRAEKTVLVADCLDEFVFCENRQMVAFDQLEEAVKTGPGGLVLAPLFHPGTLRSLDVRELVASARESTSTLILDVSDAIGIGSFPLEVQGVDVVIFSTERHLSGGPDPLIALYSPQSEFSAALSKYEVGACYNRLTSLRKSLEVFDAFPLWDLQDKLAALTDYAVHLLFRFVPEYKGKAVWISPSPGCVILDLTPAHLQALLQKRILVDIRSHHKVVITMMPLHTSFLDVFRFVERLRSVMAMPV